MHPVSRTNCRVCGSGALTKVIDLGEQFLQGSFVKPGKEQPPSRKFPTVLVRCNPQQDENACGLLQMQWTVPPDLLYSDYWYRSGTNQTMRTHLKGIASEAAAMAGKRGARALDIGCNDGTLLKCYPEHFLRIGVDPSDVARESGDAIVVIQDTFPSVRLGDYLDGKPLDIVTSIAMFYDLDRPVEFAESIKRMLAPEGVWVFEMSYMPTMLKLNSYDTICHEHLEYYSLSVLEHILKRVGFKIIRVELNTINGGSIRCYAAHQKSSFIPQPADTQRLNELRRQENEMQLESDKPYTDFQARIEEHRNELKAMVLGLKKEGKRIHIYGASTKGNTILQWSGLDGSIIEAAADRNPDKFGARTLGTNIPIISEEDSRAMKPDYYLVLPWHFRDEFLKRERRTLESGVKMIFPLPRLEIVGL